MARRLVREADSPEIKSLLQIAYAGQEWPDADVASRLLEEGVHAFDPARRAYCHLTFPVREEPLGPVPAGPCTQIATLIPQHHDQKWVDEVLAPLLALSLKELEKDRPDLVERPLYCYLEKDLYPFWTDIIPVEIIPRRSGSYLAWLPTVEFAIRKLARF